MRRKSIVRGWRTANNEQLSRPLLESIIAPEIELAAKDWINANVGGVLIGGLALSYYGKPRYTENIDILFVSDSDVPNSIPGFKRIRNHAFEHNKTQIEVEVLSASHLKMPTGLVKQIIATSVNSNGIQIASRSGLIASKLSRGNRYDQADIEQLFNTGNVDLAPYSEWLTDEQIVLYKEITKGK